MDLVLCMYEGESKKLYLDGAIYSCNSFLKTVKEKELSRHEVQVAINVL